MSHQNPGIFYFRHNENEVVQELSGKSFYFLIDSNLFISLRDILQKFYLVK